MELTSSAFKHNSDMPARYTCQGANVSPPLAIAGAPENAVSFVLIMDDPDAPDPKAPTMVWDHWVVWNIPKETKEISEDTTPGVEGRNSWGTGDYGGPCPPIGKHRYFFKLYAVDKMLTLSPDADKRDVLAAIKNHTLAHTELIGLYQKH